MNNNRNTFVTVIVILVIIVAGIWWFSARGGSGDSSSNDLTTSDENFIRDRALVKDINIQVLTSPLKVNVVATGDLPDSCTQIDKDEQNRTDRTIDVTLTTSRSRSTPCAEVITPFSKTIALKTDGLTSGTYTVTVNGVREVFTLTDTTTGTPATSIPNGFGDKL